MANRDIKMPRNPTLESMSREDELDLEGLVTGTTSRKSKCVSFVRKWKWSVYTICFVALCILFVISIVGSGLMIFSRPSVVEHTCRVMALSGGGARGVFEVGVVSASGWGAPDIITGVSAGSLNALMWSVFGSEFTEGTRILTDAWLNITSRDVYVPYINPFMHSGLYDTTPFSEWLTTKITLYGYRPLIPIRVLATSLNDGSPVVFNETAFVSVGDAVKVLMASSAVPVVFPPIEYQGKMLVDGGLFSNEIVAPAVDWCRSNRPGQNIVVDVVLCSSLEATVPTDQLERMSIVGLAWRAFEIATNSLFNHAAYPDRETGVTYRVITPVEPLAGSMLSFDPADLNVNYLIGRRSAGVSRIASRWTDVVRKVTS